MTNCKHGSRAAYFIIVEKYEEFKHIIQAKSNTIATKCKKHNWQKLTIVWMHKKVIGLQYHSPITRAQADLTIITYVCSIKLISCLDVLLWHE